MASLQNVNEVGVALQGYDPVSYFSGGPVVGNPEIFTHWSGAMYYFCSVANKKAFEVSPQRYLPQYGGFCAVAVSEGKISAINPKTYIIQDGKLYVFYNGKLGNTKPVWEAAVPIRKANANRYWQYGRFDVVYPSFKGIYEQ